MASGSFTTPGEPGPIVLSNASFTQQAGTTILALGSDIPRAVEASVSPDCDTDGVTIDVTVEILALR